MDGINATTLLTQNYLTYGKYINNGRSTVGLDGLKSVERRVLLGVKETALTKFQRSNLVCGYILGHLHPHGECYPSLCQLVLRGLVEGHGNFGSYMPNDEPAAMRYTSVKAKDKFTESIFRFADFVPRSENEFGIEEPLYLPVPMPLALVCDGSIGIGVGLLMSIPVFDARSLYAAMQEDNPALLRAPKGLTLINADLDRLWTQGEGFVQYGLKCYQEKSDIDEGRLVSVIEGSPRIFVPDLNKSFAQELAEELLYIRDESIDYVRFVISRVKGIKRIDDEMIHTKAQQAAMKTCFARLYVSDGTRAVKTPLRTWLQDCWAMYKKSFLAYQQDQISKLEYRIHLYDLIPKVYPLLVNAKGTQEIARVLEEPISVIKEIEGKPLRLLRKKDFDEEIHRLQKEVKVVQKLTAEDLGEAFIQTL